MKILVTGAGGLLGQEVWKLLEAEPSSDLWAIGRTKPVFVSDERWLECDLTNAARAYAVVTRCNPEIVIHTAAYNQVDQAEKEPDEAYRGNALATRTLALACQRFDATLLSVSTDYVFDGESAPPTGYREFDPCRPLSRYGESKYWGERFVQDLLNKFFIVRTSWLFGPSRPSWVDQVGLLVRDHKPIYALTDIVSAPTYTPDLAAGIVRLSKSRHYGIYHLTNAGFCSRADLAEEILRLHKKSNYRHLKKMLRMDLKLPAPRPAFSGLENLAWRLDGFEPLRSWQEALREHINSQKASVK